MRAAWFSLLALVLAGCGAGLDVLLSEREYFMYVGTYDSKIHTFKYSTREYFEYVGTTTITDAIPVRLEVSTDQNQLWVAGFDEAGGHTDLHVMNINRTDGGLSSSGVPTTSVTGVIKDFKRHPKMDVFSVSLDGGSFYVRQFRITNGAFDNFSSPLMGALGDPGSLLYHPSGNLLLLSGVSQEHSAQVAADGSLSTNTAQASATNDAFDFSPKGYFAVGTPYDGTGTLNYFTYNSAGSPYLTNSASTAVSISPSSVKILNDGVVFVASDSAIESVKIKSDGTGFGGIIHSEAFAGGTGSDKNRVFIDPSKEFIFVSDCSGGVVRGYRINHGTGGFSPMKGSPYGVLGGMGCPTDIAIVETE